MEILRFHRIDRFVEGESILVGFYCFSFVLMEWLVLLFISLILVITVMEMDVTAFEQSLIKHAFISWW